MDTNTELRAAARSVIDGSFHAGLCLGGSLFLFNEAGHKLGFLTGGDASASAASMLGLLLVCVAFGRVYSLVSTTRPAAVVLLSQTASLLLLACAVFAGDALSGGMWWLPRAVVVTVSVVVGAVAAGLLGALVEIKLERHE